MRAMVWTVLVMVLMSVPTGVGGIAQAQKLDPGKAKADATKTAKAVSTKPAPDAAAKAKLWEAIKSGNAVALMRHSIAPGVGDPGNFKLGNCKTQRNLSDEGRKQAKAIGDIFRSNGIKSAQVYSSAWCRTQETAKLLGLGKANNFPPLNSFFQNVKRKPAQTRMLKLFVLRARGGKPKVLVTHQVNISALTGASPKPGEIVVVAPTKDKKIKVLGAL